MTMTICRIAMLFLFMISILTGCGGGNKSMNADRMDDLDGDIEMLTWETSGGGEMRFVISRDAGDFMIDVKSYAYQSIDSVIYLKKTDDEVYRLVEDIFNKNIDISDYTFTPEGVTGSWTTITLTFSDNEERIIKDIRAWGGDLHVLYDFVKETIESAHF